MIARRCLARWAMLAPLCLSALAAFAQAAAPAPDVGYYRYPALRGQQLVFVAEGDLWRVGIDGGRAERITSHPGAELRPALSADGRRLAFSGSYEGPQEAYVMPSEGGLPQRLTWSGQGARVWGFTPAGEVLIGTRTASGRPGSELIAVHPDSGARRTLPATQVNDGAFSADGRTLYVTRSGLQSDNARHYRGGALASLWALDLSAGTEARPLVTMDANARRPMPYAGPGGPRVAFLSDRDGRFNIWSVDALGRDLRQHTRHRDFDVRQPSIDGQRVVYALGADLHVVDLGSQADRRVPIRLSSDFDQQRQRWLSPGPWLTQVGIAPDGERVVLTARGRLATQGAGPLRLAELPVPTGTRCRNGTYGHDKQFVFAMCDTTGEVEVWRFPADGRGSPLQITRGSEMLRTTLHPSPDGRWLAHLDKNGRLSLTALHSDGNGATRVLDAPDARQGSSDLVWSPDSRAFALTRYDAATGRGRVVLHLPGANAAGDRSLVLTSDRYDSDAPAFTPDGRWLYFLSDRQFTATQPFPWGDRVMGPYFDRRTKVYALALQPVQRWPFKPKDELDAAPDRKPAVAAGAASAASAASAAGGSGHAAGGLPSIVVEGLTTRLHEVPMPAGNYSKLRVDGKRLYLLDTAQRNATAGTLRTLAIDNLGGKPETLAENVRDFELTADGKKLMLVRSAPPAPPAPGAPVAGDILLVDAGPKLPAETANAQVRWTDWKIAIDPRAEWRQMFDDAWRMQRDYFWDRAMLGVDWLAVRKRFEPLLARVTERDELNDLLAQMVSELGTLHSQVFSPDLRTAPQTIAAAGLGGRFRRSNDGFVIERIYRTDPELLDAAGPLAAAGAQEGETVVAVNGRPTPAVADLSELLRGQAGRQVLLALRSSQGTERALVVTPVDAQAEDRLRTSDWEWSLAERTLARSEGRIGYLRLRAMVASDIATFAREFFAHAHREGLIIDVRSNNGGAIDSFLISALMRRAWAFWQGRSPETAPPYSNMQQAFRGHLTVLVDEGTYSDGETFAEGVKRLKLGTLIGQRTAGAGVWLSDRNRLVDNGLMRAAESGQFVPGDGWIIEGRGVTPDIEVDNLPRATFEGGDAQLDAAIAHLQKQIGARPLPKPVAPAHPRLPQR